MNDNVHPLPKHRAKPGKHRADTDDGAIIHYIVTNCEELRTVIKSTDPQTERTRNYLINKANEFGCMENIPYDWYQ